MKSLEENKEKVFTSDEVNLFIMTKLLFSVNDFDLLVSFLENIITNKADRNVLGTMDLFNKLKKHRVELINNEIVSIDEIETLFNARPDIVTRNKRDGVVIYTIVNQDFRILCSTNDDGINYDCVNVSKLNKNVYAYDRLTDERSVRFVTEDNNVIIKINNDNYNEQKMEATYIVVTSKLSPDLLEIAKENNLKIVEIQN